MNAAQTRLLLLGGGHAHLQVLRALAQRPIPGLSVDLLTPYGRQIYSGMLPGWLAGDYTVEDCSIDLERLGAHAAVRLRIGACTGLDPERRRIACADGSVLGFDLLSIDTGPEPALATLPGAREHALPIRPIEGFVAGWPALADRIRRHPGRFELLIVGAGAAGVELAFAIRQRALIERWHHLHMVLTSVDPLPLAGFPVRLRQRVLRGLVAKGVGWVGERRASRVEAGLLHVERRAPMAFDGCLLACGAAAPAWPRAAGLATDAEGFIRVTPTLQSVSHAGIFAAGDVAALADPRPKSGVYAVRAGTVLAANLRAQCEGLPLRAWTPQRRALYLLSTGDRRALATWGPWSIGGGWVWRWKDSIDRGFVSRFAGASTGTSSRDSSGDSAA